MKKIRDNVKARSAASAAKMVTDACKKQRKRASVYAIGDTVWVKLPSKDRRLRRGGPARNIAQGKVLARNDSKYKVQFIAYFIMCH